MNYIRLNLDYVALACRHIEINPTQKASYLAALNLMKESPQEISMHWLRAEYVKHDLVDIPDY
jgi:hypothetical protein